MSKRIKQLLISVIIAGGILLGLLVLCGISVKGYLDKVPKLMVKGQRIVEAEQTLALSDIVDVECKGDYRLELAIDSKIDDAKVSEDKQSLFVGSNSGNIRVIISGYGEVTEFVSEETVIHVSLGAQERKEMKERAAKIAQKVDTYITSKEEYNNVKKDSSMDNVDCSNIILEQAIYDSKIYYDDNQEFDTQLDMKYKKEDGTPLYLHVQYGQVGGEDYLEIGERDMFKTSSWCVSGQNDAYINIGDNVYARLHDVIDGEVMDLGCYNYMFFIDEN
jgi:hypothetical protein